jgi:hypothetical protein
MENMENLKNSEEKTCTKCKKTRQKMTPYIIMSVVVFGLVIYAVVDITKNIIDLFYMR